MRAAHRVRAGRRSRWTRPAPRPFPPAARRRVLRDGAAPARPLLPAYPRNRSPVRSSFVFLSRRHSNSARELFYSRPFTVPMIQLNYDPFAQL